MTLETYPNKTAPHFANLVAYMDSMNELGLTMNGPAGTGKTVLTTIAFRLAVMDDGEYAGYPDHANIGWWTSEHELLFALRQDIENRRSVALPRAKRTKNLMIDDFASTSASDWAYDHLFQIIDFRYTHGLRTFLTINSDLSKFKDRRIAGRIREMTNVIRVANNAPDLRT